MTKTPAVLVISGGGLKGVAFIGTLTALRDNGVRIHDIKVLCGSSIGSVIATSLALGHSLEDIRQKFEACANRISTMFDTHPRPKILNMLFNKFSLTDGAVLESELCQVFEGFDRQMLTFKRLRKMTKKDLVISGSNTTTMQPEYFSYRHTPNMLVYDALRISCSVPGIFPPIELPGGLYVDGNVFDPFPIAGCKKKIIRRAREGSVIGLELHAQHGAEIKHIVDFMSRIVNGMVRRYYGLFSKDFKVISIPVHADNFLVQTPETSNLLFDTGYEHGQIYSRG